MKMRVPATPIVNIDPYFSVCCEKSVLENTVHWTGSPNTISGNVFIDGKEFHFLGFKASEDIPNMTVENTYIDAFSTEIIYTNENIRLKIRFTSPLLPNNLYYTSRPVSYCKAEYESTDGKEHSVKIKFAVSEELVLNLKGEGRALSYKAEIKR